MKYGVIEVLAVGKGHETVELPEDGNEAKVKVDDLLKRSYMLTVPKGDAHLKVTGFDAATKEYIAQDTDEVRIAASTVKATAVAPAAGG